MTEIKDLPTDLECIDHAVVITKENRKYLVHKRLLEQSPVIRNILMEMENDGLEIPLPDMESRTLQCVFDFQTYHEANPLKEIEKPLRAKLQDVLSEWDYEFYKTRLLENGDESKNSQLFKVLKAANFLILLPLRDLCCAAVAASIMGKSETEILSFFQIKEPVTPECEKKLYDNYPWLREKC